MDTLPEDILLIVVNQLSYIDNLNLLKVNKTFNKFIKNNQYISLNDIVNLNKINEPDKIICVFPNIKFYYDKYDNKLLKYINYIHTLDLSCTDITDYSLECCMLGNAHNLKELDLSETDITDISSLSNIYSLEKLNLRYTKITDRSLECNVLSNFHCLKELDLSCTNISDCSSLGDVYHLDLCYTDITDISALINVHSLRVLYLSISNNIINETEILKKLVNVNVTYLY